MSKVIYLVWFAQLLLTTVQSVSTPPKSGNKGKRKEVSIRRSQVKVIPPNLNINTISFNELVSWRPYNHATAQGNLYKGYFANHPEVRKIDLNSKHATESLLALSGDGTQDKGWKNRMSASLKQFLKDAPIKDEKRRSSLIGSVIGQRYAASRVGAHQRYTQKWNPEELQRRHRLAEARYEQKHGMKYGQRRVNLQKKNPFLDLPLSFHLDGGDNKKYTALEAELKTRELGDFYTSQSVLTREFDNYLKQKNYPPSEYSAAKGIRTKTVNLIGKEKKRLRDRQDDLQPIQPSIHAFVESVHQPFLDGHASTSSPSQPAHNNQLDQLDYDWLNSILYPDDDA